MQVFVDSALTICSGSVRRDNTFDWNAFLCFFTMFRVWGSGFQPGGCLPAFCGFWDEILINIKYIHTYFYISYFVRGTTYAIPKTMGLLGSNAVNNFVWEGLVIVVVSHWRLGNCFGGHVGILHPQLLWLRN